MINENNLSVTRGKIWKEMKRGETFSLGLFHTQRGQKRLLPDYSFSPWKQSLLSIAHLRKWQLYLPVAQETGVADHHDSSPFLLPHPSHDHEVHPFASETASALPHSLSLFSLGHNHLSPTSQSPLNQPLSHQAFLLSMQYEKGYSPEATWTKQIWPNRYTRLSSSTFLSVT